uniref:Putative transposable element n=1 Tax=Amblyomma americanum TaxID=6943 RepID=A0A0C9SE54_AMBAM
MPRISEERRRQIVNLHLQGYSHRAISAIVGCTRSSTLRIVHAYREEGRIGDAFRSGRARVTTDFEDLMIVAALVDEPFLSTADIKRELNLKASENVIRLRLQEAGLACWNGNTRLSLTPAYKAMRLKFATKHSSWTAEQWQRVVFTNESTICCKWDKSKHSWRVLQNWNDPVFVRQLTASNYPFINVWTMVTYQGLGPIVRIENGSLTPEDYIKLIDNVMLPFLLDGPFRDGGFILQQDATSTYTCEEVRSHLQAHDIEQLRWPPKCEDLSAIRSAWGVVKERLWRRRLNEVVPDNMWALIEKEWNKLKGMPNLVRSFYATIPDKIQEVIELKGGAISQKEPTSTDAPDVVSTSMDNWKESVEAVEDQDGDL